jgi:serine/threonine protein kinase
MIQPGTILSERYEVIAELGRGGMGIVFRGRNVNMDRPVAIKVFNDQLDGDATKRAQREAHALGNVQHPNLVRVFSLETDESGRLMMVFDLIEGKPLSAILTERQLEPNEVTSLFRQLCDGLKALHAAGFVHRDLKPSNLIVSTDLHLTVIDFGLVKSTAASQKLTATGAIMGTPAYMSPEQFAGAPSTTQSDLYSAACVVYEMLAGKPPFEGESPYMVAHAQLHEPPPKLFPPLDAFFLKALAKKPEDRFTNASEMFSAFDDASVGFEKIGKNADTPVRTAIKSKPNAAVILAAVALVASLAAFALIRTKHSSGQLDAAAAQLLEDVKKFPRYPLAADTWQRIADYYRNRVPQLETIGAEASSSAAMCRVYDDYGNMLLFSMHPSKAVVQLEKAIAIAQRNGDERLIDTVNMHLAGAYDRNAQYAQSLECWRKFTKGNLRRIDTENMCFLTHALARQGLSQELVDAFEDRIVQERDAQMPTTMANRRWLACAYIDLDRPNDAIKLILQNEPLKAATEQIEITLAQDLIHLTRAYALANKQTECMATIRKGEKLEYYKEVRGLPEAARALLAANNKDEPAYRRNLAVALGTKYHHQSVRQNRDALLDGIMCLKLCRKAAGKMQDREGQQKVDDLINKLKAEYESQRDA